MVAWVLCDSFLGKARTVTGICNSLIIGLVAITPSAGLCKYSLSNCNWCYFIITFLCSNYLL